MDRVHHEKVGRSIITERTQRSDIMIRKSYKLDSVMVKDKINLLFIPKDADIKVHTSKKVNGIYKGKEEKRFCQVFG
jgi:hypothetical protein